MTAGVPKKSRQTVEQELEALLLENHEQMYQVARRITGSHQDAEDVVQEVFTRLLARVIEGPSASGFVKKPAAYLHQAAIHEARSVVRSRERRRLVDQEPKSLNIPAPEIDLESAERQWCVRAAIAGMKPNFIEVLNLHDMEGYSCSEIAEMRGKTTGTVLAELWRARSALRKLIRNEEKDRETQKTKHQGNPGSILAGGSEA